MSDFLIIGGGIVGISAAARLAAHGTVTLLEAEDNFGYHASGRSAALYEPHYGAAPVVALSLASGDYFRALPNLLSPRGLLMVAKADQKASFAAECAAMNIQPISAQEAQHLVPILNLNTVAYAGYGSHAWDMDTGLLMAHFVKIARDHGAQMMTNAMVTGITRANGFWQVTTRDGPFKAKVLVNAAGPWADEIAAMVGAAPKGMTPLRRSMARIAAPGGLDVARWPMIFGTGETWYAKPDAGALIVSPAEEDPMPPHDAFADDMVLAEGLARYEEMVIAPVTRLLANWAGLRTFAPDRVPVIGADPAVPDFFWAAGLGGYGFQTADGASRLLANLVLGQETDLDQSVVKAVLPARFG